VSKLHLYYFAKEEQFKRCSETLEGRALLGDGRYFLGKNRSAFFNLRNKGGATGKGESAQQNIASLRKQLDGARSSEILREVSPSQPE